MANPIPLQFPLGGVSENAPYAGDPKPVLVKPEHCLNVRPHDSIERRQRGGKRTGISKFFETRPNAGRIQFIGRAVEAVALEEDAGFGSKYADPSRAIDQTGFVDAVYGIDFHPDGNYVAIGTDGQGGGNSPFVIYEFNTVTGWGDKLDDPVDTPAGDVHCLAFSHDGRYIAVGHSSTPQLSVYPFDAETGTIGARLSAPSTADEVVDVAFHPSDGYIAVAYGPTSPHFEVFPFDGDAGTIGSKLSDPGTLPNSHGYAVTFSPDGTVVAVGAFNDIAVYEFDADAGTIGSRFSDPADDDLTQNRAVAFHPNGEFLFVGGSDSPYLVAFQWSDETGFGSRLTPSDLPGSLAKGIAFTPTGSIVACVHSVSGGNSISVYPFSSSFGDELEDAANQPGTNGESIAFHPDGTAIALGHNDDPDATIWAFQTATTNPSARKARVVAVQQGNVYRSNHPPSLLALSNSGEDALNASIPVSGAEVFQRMFFCDGASANYVYLNFADNTVYDWASDLTAGSLPAGTDDTDLACRFMVVYRGRVVMSGLREEPQNWFMSKAGDPFDWDYSPAETSPIQAVAGNASNAGELGDVVTALCPYQDDVMVMGGSSSLWLMRGDPAAGGQIDNISRQVGIVGPEAWTWDIGSVLWFFGPNGLYRMQPGGSVPELVSRGKLDRTFTSIDTSANNVRLVYDRQWQGVHIFITPTDEPDEPMDHWFFDQRTGSFWRDQYPTNIGPTAMHLFEADDPDQRAVLLGGFDGYLRFFDPNENDDDGEAVTSFVRLPMIHPGLPMGQFQMSDMQVHTDAASNGLTLEVYRGKTPEEAAEATTAAFSKVLQPGRNLPIRKRLRANTLQMRLHHEGAAKTWAYENGSVIISGVGRQRARL